MKFFNRYIALGISLLMILAIGYYFSDIVAYVLVSWVLSLVGQPFMRFFEAKLRFGRFKAGRTMAAVLTLLSFLIITTLLIWMFVPLVIQQARNLAEVDYQAVTQALQEPLERLRGYLEKIGVVLPGQTLEGNLQDLMFDWFQPAQIGNFLGSLLGVFGNLMFALFSVLFITFFFLKEQRLFGDFVITIAPNKYEDEVRHGLENITRLLTRYFAGILIQITIITLFVSVALGILGVKNALLIGFFAAVINVIPYLGPIIGFTFGAFITVSSNLDLDFYSQMFPLLIKVFAVFAAMQLLDNFVLQPYIFSNSVLAHPLEIFIIILMGAKLNGIVGMVLAIPVYTVLRVIARVFLSEFKIVQKLTNNVEI